MPTLVASRPLNIPHSRPSFSDDEAQAVQAALADGLVARGARVTAFEASLAAYVGMPFAMATTSGTEALVLALAGVGVRAGDEVVIPTYVCNSVRAAVKRLGAIAVLCDSGTDWVMTADTVAQVVTARTRAVVAVHILGLRCDIESIARATSLPVIEDACQAFALAGRSAAAVCTVLSFHATKCLTTGEGGALLSRNTAFIEHAERAGAEGVASSRMSDVQAAIGIVQLNKHGHFLERRRDIAARYDAELPAELTERWQTVSQKGTAFFRYPLWLGGRNYDEVHRRCALNGVSVRRGVDAMLHREGNALDAHFPGALKCFENTCSIPLWPAMSDDDVSQVINVVTEHVVI